MEGARNKRASRASDEVKSRRMRASAASFLLHVALLMWLAVLPSPLQIPFPEEAAPPRTYGRTRLIVPPAELREPAPSRETVAREIVREFVAPAPASQRAVMAPPQVAPALPEMVPPDVAASQELPYVEMPVPQPEPPPKEEPLQLAFETPGAAQPSERGLSSGLEARPLIPVPNTSVEALARQLAGGNRDRRFIIGDVEPRADLGGVAEARILPPSGGATGSNLALLSDPGGVDFQPYLIQVLAAVRRNFRSVMPESARLGRRGRVGIQLSIDRSGRIPKLVISGSSGFEPYDRAAVAAVAASEPFPPLPEEFPGEEIRVQINFLYNVLR